MKRYVLCFLQSASFSRWYVREWHGIYNDTNLVKSFIQPYIKEFGEKPLTGKLIVQNEDLSIHYDNVFLILGDKICAAK